MSVPSILANHLHSQARWREMKAEEWPDDDRNPIWAARLNTIADWVAEQDPADERFIRLAPYVSDDGHIAAGCPSSEQYTMKPRDIDPDQWLTEFVDVFIPEYEREYGDLIEA